MAHAFSPAAVDAQPRRSLDAPEIIEARIDLAACFRMAAHLGLEEGICHHFSAVVPGHDDLFLVNPYGMSFDEIRASDLLICDFAGRVVAGEGRPEATAFFIHARLHALNPRAKAAFHTHMPNATALCMTEGQPLQWAGQTALKFYGRTAVDDHFNGLTLDSCEGERIAQALGGADVLFLRNHGVMVTAPNIAEAWDDLYYLERAAQVQLKAMASRRALVRVPDEIAQRCYERMREEDPESARLHLESIKRRLTRLAPEYAH